jgi:hypothetical protein
MAIVQRVIDFNSKIETAVRDATMASQPTYILMAIGFLVLALIGRKASRQ